MAKMNTTQVHAMSLRHHHGEQQQFQATMTIPKTCLATATNVERWTMAQQPKSNVAASPPRQRFESLVCEYLSLLTIIDK